MRHELCVLIPAVKKNVAFPDDLIKRLAGVSLIQRAVNTGLNLVEPDHVYVITDSQEISLISERAGVNHFYKQELRLSGTDILKDLRLFILKLYKKYTRVMILHPYVPLLPVQIIRSAYDHFTRNGYQVMLTVKKQRHRTFNGSSSNLSKAVFSDDVDYILNEVKAFLIFNSDLIKTDPENITIHPFILDENTIEINSYQDWWVCEKLLLRKRIIFRIIGNKQVGMGHVYRALTLAHEISDHEIIFVCEDHDSVAISQVAGNDYLLRVFSTEQVEDEIINLKPDLVVNDILDTENLYIEKLKAAGISVVNFEDLGSGVGLADLAFNELYDEPVVAGEKIRWGHEYYFLRDEFIDAKPRPAGNEVRSIIITFGGTDQHNLTMKVLASVVPFCRERGIMIYVVTGAGYPYKNELVDYIDRSGYDRIEFTYATGVISKIMEKSDLAISSNGRTVYELCHMNIPGLIISQHERERTHHFSKPENGFIPLGVYKEGKTEAVAAEALAELVNDRVKRFELFNRMTPFNFAANKPGVVSLIQGLLNSNDK